MRYAFFISPHGYGHASRSLAVMDALQEADPNAFFHIFTSVPQWFFKRILPGKFTYHHQHCDAGLAQPDPFTIDFAATLRALAELLPFRPSLLKHLAKQLQGCCLVVCDIAPLGIAAAREAGIPSVLLESFTWDWIYGHYETRTPALRKWSAMLAEWFAKADFHVQTEPLCRRDPTADLHLASLGQQASMDRNAVRKKLKLREEEKAVLLSFGGIAVDGYVAMLGETTTVTGDIAVIFPSEISVVERNGNVIMVPQKWAIPHADVVNACDGLICKAGYSTLVEAFHAGISTACILRHDWPESAVLAAFADGQMQAFVLEQEQACRLGWLSIAKTILQKNREPVRTNEAKRQVADFLVRKAAIAS